MKKIHTDKKLKYFYKFFCCIDSHRMDMKILIELFE